MECLSHGGGLLGSSNSSINITDSGVLRGTIKGGRVACIVGDLEIKNQNTTILQVYCKEEVVVSASGAMAGGIFGRILFSNNFSLVVSNFYSRANISSSSDIVGGFVGLLDFNTSMSSVSISDSYISSFILATDAGQIAGQIMNLSSFISSNFFYNYQLNSSLPMVGIGMNSSIASGNNCTQLLNKILTFNQTAWGGINLRIEFNFTISTILCTTPIPNTNEPSTGIPSTEIPSTHIASSNIPSTEIPSTHIASSNIPSTEIPSTRIASSNIPSTNIPSTALSSSTNPLSTSVPLTLSSSTTSPSTNPPTNLPTTTSSPTTSSPTTSPTISPTTSPTTSSPTNSPITILPSTNSPSTPPPSTTASTTMSNTMQTSVSPSTNASCIYNVPNCINCDQSISSIVSNQINVSCEINQGKWNWIFKNSTSNDFFLSSNISLGAPVSFDSNLVIETNASVILVFQNSQNSSSPAIEVNGCVSIEGDLNLLIDFKVEQDENFDLIKYNCQQNAVLKNDDSVKLIYNRDQNSCLTSKPKVTTNIISTTISSCGKSNLGVIVGLSVGIPLLMVLIVATSLFIARKKQKREVKAFKSNLKGNEMKEWNQNDSHVGGDQTNWKDFEQN